MLSQKTKSAFSKIVGPERFHDDLATLSSHSYDSYSTGGRADAVVFPKSTVEISKLLEIANQEAVPVTTRGAGTNLSGGSVPINGGLVLCLTQMNRILKIAPKDRYAVTQPGVVNEELQIALGKNGFFFPPDPSSYTVSTIGGNIAENAGGPRCLKYGVTSDYVLGLEAVLASGKIVRLGSANVKDVTGYRPAGIFCGSEGTLGIITEATLKIIPIPKAKRTAMLVYQNLNDTAQTVADIIGEGILPAAMELMDNGIINLIEDYMNIGLPRTAEGVLLIDLDGMPEMVQKEMELVERIGWQNKAIQISLAKNSQECDELWKGRRAVYGLLNKVSPTVLVEDATVPVSKVPDMIRGCRKIAEEFGLKISIVGHAGDGNLHPSINTDARDKEKMQRVDLAVRKIFSLALDLGGCLSGEHGIGLGKKAFLPMALGDDTIDFLQMLKKSVDPLNILNPGKFV